MKKILLASTMLVSVAGYAAAEVAVSGDARMGITSYNGDTEFSNRVRISFSGSGTTDGGLAFGGSIRADNAGDNGDDNNNGADGTAGSVFISGAFGKISMGDVDSGDAAAVGQLSSVGYEGLGSGNSIAYAADGGGIGFGENDVSIGASARVLYTYTAGALTINASTSQIDNSEDDGNGNYYGNMSYGLGVSYTTGAVTVALGYGETSADYVDSGDTYTDSINDVSASVKYVAGDTTVKAIYQDKTATDDYWDGSVDEVSMGASVDHKIDALTVTAYVLSSEFSADNVDGTLQLNRMGLGAAYDLGGGATFKAGWSQIEVAVGTESESEDNFDAGVNFSF